MMEIPAALHRHKQAKANHGQEHRPAVRTALPGCAVRSCPSLVIFVLSPYRPIALSPYRPIAQGAYIEIVLSC